MKLRLACKTFGCEPLNGPYCIRCYTDIYDDDFIQYGWLEPVFRAWWRVRAWVKRFLPMKCEVCGRKYRKGYDQYVCSAECFDEWLPF